MANKYKLPKIEELLDAGVHFGHQVRRWHPSMEKYIYSVRKNIHIIDLEKTEELLTEAADFLYETAAKGGKIIFVGTKKQARDVIEIEGKRSGAMYVTERWLGGTITNLEVIKVNNIDKLIDFKTKKEKGDFSMYTKKERLLIDREIERLEKYVGGLTTLNRKPDVVFVVDAKREKTAVKEANSAKIPVVALLDTNTNPSGIKYPIPGNDDAIRSIAVIVKALGDAIEAGYRDYAEKGSSGAVEAAEQAKKNLDAVVKGHSEKKEATEEKVEAEKKGSSEEKVADKSKVEVAKKEEKKEEKKSAAKETTKKDKKTASKSVKKETEKVEPKKRGRPKKSESK